MTNCVKKSCNWHLTKMVFCVFLFINFLIGFALKNTNHYNLNIVTIFPLLICWFIQHGWFLFLAPVMAFHIYFLEISVMLLPWSWSLKEKLKESPLNFNLFLKRLKRGVTKKRRETEGAERAETVVTVLSPLVPYDVISANILSQISVNFFYYIDHQYQAMSGETVTVRYPKDKRSFYSESHK